MIGRRALFLLLGVIVLVLAIINLATGYKYSINYSTSVQYEKAQATDAEGSQITTDMSTTTIADGISCLSANSKSWLEGPRYGNIDANNSHPLPLNGPLLSTENLKLLLGQQKICHENCRFKNLDNDGDYEHPSEDLIHIWKIRLMYVSIYHHQHKVSIQEAKEREQLQRLQGANRCKKDTEKYGVGTFDYECKGAKYIALPLRNNGLGSVVLRDIINNLMYAIVTNRTLVTYSNIKVNNGTLPWKPRWKIYKPFESWGFEPWAQANCDRRDCQCAFQPMTACAPRIDDIVTTKGVDFNMTKMTEFGKYGRINTIFLRSSPLIQGLVGKPELSQGTYFLETIHQIANSLIDELDSNDRRISVLRRASLAITQETSQDKVGQLNSDFHHAAVMYALRPNVEMGKELERSFRSDIPDDFDWKRTLGMAIRGSDKCLKVSKESQCLQTFTYVTLMGKIWSELELSKRYTDGNTNVLVTSEIPDIMEQLNQISNNQSLVSKLGFKPQWITNKIDVRQGTGQALNSKISKDTKDLMMISMLSALKLHMGGAHTVGTCCSNFHLLIFHFLRGGCGLAPENKGTCLQDRKESIYRVCCLKMYQHDIESCKKSRTEGIIQDLGLSGSEPRFNQLEKIHWEQYLNTPK